MVRIIGMTALEDDVAIDEMVTLSEDVSLRDIYDFVKDIAMTEANLAARLNTQGRRRYLVEMGENEEGLPHASMYINNVIERQIFATST